MVANPLAGLGAEETGGLVQIPQLSKPKSPAQVDTITVVLRSGRSIATEEP